MLQLRNESPFAAAIGRFPDPDGIDTLFAVVKGTFTSTDRPTVVEKQPPVVAGPEYHGDPATGSLKRAPELGLAKPTTDILVHGHAYARDGRPTPAMDVSVQVGAVSASLRVYGDRVWERGTVGYAASSPQPFTMMPLVWERAFGGTDEVNGERHDEPRNPVGVGFRRRSGDLPVDGSPLPNIERAGSPMVTWTDTPSPAGFAAVSPHWEPRRSYAGTYDDAWQRHRAPYLPVDFDPRFLQCAPAELIAPSFLIGGEPVVLTGLSPHGPVRFSLPRATPDVVFVLDGTPHARPAFIDTLIFDTDRHQFSLVWRAAFPCDKRALRVSEIRVGVQQARELETR